MQTIGGANNQMMDYIAITFYTKGSVYQQYAQTLAESADKLHIPFRAYAYDDRGSWKLNTHIKPEVILRALEEYYPASILFIDSDAIIRKPLGLFDDKDENGNDKPAYDYDLGATWVTVDSHGEKMQIIANGTIWVRNIPEVWRYIKAWQEHLHVTPRLFEQDEFGLIYKAAIWDGIVKVDPAFPAEYCQVCLKTEDGQMIPVDEGVRYEDVVIEQGRNFDKPWGLKK